MGLSLGLGYIFLLGMVRELSLVGVDLYTSPFIRCIKEEEYEHVLLSLYLKINSYTSHLLGVIIRAPASGRNIGVNETDGEGRSRHSWIVF